MGERLKVYVKLYQAQGGFMAVFNGAGWFDKTKGGLKSKIEKDIKREKGENVEIVFK